MKGKKNKCDFKVKAEEQQLHLLDDYFKSFFDRIKQADNKFCGTMDKGKLARLLKNSTGGCDNPGKP